MKGGRVGRSGAWALLFLGLLSVTPAAAGRPAEAARVVILANAADPESVELAEFYAARREIPRDNIVALPMARDEVIDWRAYVGQLHEPLLAWLLERGWIDAIRMDLWDAAGRRKHVVFSHRISYLVVCRGVPLKIRETPGVPPDGPALPATVRTHRAAVDSELATLGLSGPPLDGFVPNPLYGGGPPAPGEPAGVVRVSRLDGPTLADARQLVVGAQEAERWGLWGRAYLDRGGPHALAEGWLEAAGRELERLGFETIVDRGTGTFGPADRVDAAAVYLGWYDEHISGPFRPAAYRFAPGAIALHIHSHSAHSLHDRDGAGWSGPLVARGAAATVGNVYEPYLEYTHQPHRLVRALARGETWGQAAFAAMPVVSWQGVVLGDPLYRPFPPGWDHERHVELGAPARVRAAAALQQAHQLEREGRAGDARARVEEAMASSPSPALALDLAHRAEVSGDPVAAVELLNRVRALAPVPPAEWALLAAAARALHALHAGAAAVETWAALLAHPLPPAARRVWLGEAVAAARAAGRSDLARTWEQELAAAAAGPR